MRRYPFAVIIVTAALLAAGAVALGGCSPQRAISPSSATAPTQSTDPLVGVKAAPLEVMSAANKRSKIATSFPLEVPVANGQVTRHDAQSDTAWDYELVVPGGVLAVERWYLETYLQAEWELVTRGTNEFTLRKGSAETRLQFAQGPKPGTTVVTASVGVGTSVLTTQ